MLKNLKFTREGYNFTVFYTANPNFVLWKLAKICFISWNTLHSCLNASGNWKWAEIWTIFIIQSDIDICAGIWPHLRLIRKIRINLPYNSSLWPHLELWPLNVDTWNHPAMSQWLTPLHLLIVGTIWSRQYLIYLPCWPFSLGHEHSSTIWSSIKTSPSFFNTCKKIHPLVGRDLTYFCWPLTK